MNSLSPGLLIGVIGSAVVILPTFPAIERHIINQDRIESLEKARRRLTKDGDISIDNPCFGAVVGVIDKKWDETLMEECHGFHIPRIGYTINSGNTAYSHGTIVYSIDSSGIGMENPLSEGDSQEIESIFVVDSWLEEEIRRLKTVPIQRVRGLGFLLIVVSAFI